MCSLGLIPGWAAYKLHGQSWGKLAGSEVHDSVGRTEGLLHTYLTQCHLREVLPGVP